MNALPTKFPWGRKSRNRSGFEVVMPGRLSDGERSSESRSTALRRGAAFGNMRKLTMRPGGVGHKRARAIPN